EMVRDNFKVTAEGRPPRKKIPERFPSKVRDPAGNNDPHKIGRREPRAEYLGWLHCRQINDIVDHCAWMSSQADSRVAYPGRTLVFLANCYTRNRVIHHSFCGASLACLLRVIRVDFDSFDQLTAGPQPLQYGHKVEDRRAVPEAAVSNRSKTRLYSITSSARASSVGGTSRAEGLRGFEIDDQLDFTDCWTGKSAGSPA